MSDDFLGVGPLLVERLVADLPPEVRAATMHDLASVASGQQAVPAVFVAYDGYRVVDSSLEARLAIEQTWLTVVAVRNVRDALIGDNARSEAGAIAARVIESLHRARLPGIKPLRFASAPRPGFSAGYYYLPLAWTVPLTLRSDTCPN